MKNQNSKNCHRNLSRRGRGNFFLTFILAMGLPAHYASAQYTVTTTAPTGAGSLTDAITSANGNPGSTILFDNSISGETITLSTLQTLSAPVTITGMSNTITSTDATNPVFSVAVSSGSVVLDSLTFLGAAGTPGTTGLSANGTTGATGNFLSTPGGAGGIGGTGGAGGLGETGGIGMTISGDADVMIGDASAVTISGGAGGAGGNGGDAIGGTGGAGYVGTPLFGTSGVGGVGNAGGAGGAGASGSAGGDGLDISGGTVTVGDDVTIVGGNGGTGGNGGSSAGGTGGAGGLNDGNADQGLGGVGGAGNTGGTGGIGGTGGTGMTISAGTTILDAGVTVSG